MTDDYTNEVWAATLYNIVLILVLGILALKVTPYALIGLIFVMTVKKT